MKFQYKNKITNKSLREDIDFSEKEYHFYGDTKNGLYYFDGEKLNRINPSTAEKLLNRSLEDQYPDDETPDERQFRISKIKNMLKSDEIYNVIKGKKYDFDYSGEEAPTTSINPSDRTKQLLKNSIEDFIESNYKIGYGKSHGESRMSVDHSIIGKKSRLYREAAPPTVALYFDRSGSWYGKYVSDFGNEIRNLLKRYEEEGRINIETYYFSIGVYKKEKTALDEGPNSGEIIIQHMIQTAPENVIIMTDRHLSHPDDEGYFYDKKLGRYRPDYSIKNPKPTIMKSKYVAPGAVWGIFVGNDRSYCVPDTLLYGFGESDEWHLKGSELTKAFTFEEDTYK